MPENAVSPFNIVEAALTVKVGASAALGFTQHVSNVVCAPTTATSTWKGMSQAAVFQFISRAVWGLTMGLAQDWSSTGLSRFLFENEGKDAVFTFAPVAGGQGFSVTATITPGAFGGAVDSVGEASVVLPVKGRPTLVAAVTPVA